jgi:hypothetical protein
VRTLLIVALLTILLSACATWRKDTYAAWHLPPDQCEAAIDKAYENRDDYYEEATKWLPYKFLVEDKAKCYWRDKDVYEYKKLEAAQWIKAHPESAKANPVGSRTATTAGLDTGTMLSLYTLGAAAGAVINGNGSSTSSQNVANVIAATNSTASTGAYSPNGPAPSFLPGTPSGPDSQTMTTAATNDTGSSRPSAAGMTLKSYRSAAACVRRDSKSNSLGDFWINDCNFTVMINWIDGEACRRGCGAGPISPGRKESTTKATGPYRVAACEYPGLVRSDSNTEWTGDTGYRCLGH